MPELDADGLADLKVTVTLTYKADPADYTDDNGFSLEGSLVEQMSAIDKKNFEDDPDCLLEILNDYAGSYAVTVEPLPEGEV